MVVEKPSIFVRVNQFEHNHPQMPGKFRFYLLKQYIKILPVTVNDIKTSSEPNLPILLSQVLFSVMDKTLTPSPWTTLKWTTLKID